MRSVTTGDWLATSAPRAIGIGVLLALVLLGSAARPLRGQSTNATVTGEITDQTGKVVPGVMVTFTNINNGVASATQTNGSGIYVLSTLQPGVYRANVTKDGFKGIVKPDIELHVQDQASINFSLQVGSISETVTVEAGGINVDTTDAAVGTIIDRQFVDNIPLNGRSLQSLISLAPGVLIVPGGQVGVQGEFSVNGQRTEANYFTVDGVSGNTGASPNSVLPSFGGAVPGETALGTTQSMISLDALSEFRATTSTYSAEYGRTPGGQFSFVSRSGTNDWHGSAFDYFRNNVLDANNWFNNALGFPKTVERQNDFGGTLGGPLRIPGLYNGKDKTFFFFSYEGLRLVLPAGVAIDQYPDTSPGLGVASGYTGLRENAPAVLQPFLNAFPVPNGPEVSTPCDNVAYVCPGGQPVGTPVPSGLALFTAAYSNPSSLDSISIRVDHNVSGSMKIFGRYTDSPSSTSMRQAGSDLANLQIISFNVKSLTVGATNAFSSWLNNDFRFNYTRNNGTSDSTLDNFGGAQPFNISQAPGFGGVSAPSSAQFAFKLTFGQGPGFNLGPLQNAQQQWNVTDGFSVNRGSHNLKFGIDYRKISTYARNGQLEEDGFFSSNSEVLQNAPDFIEASSEAAVLPRPLYTNFSVYAQDEWKVTQKLSLSLGLRWDLDPPPGNGNGVLPYTLNQITDLNTAQLAPTNTPLWHTDYLGFAPRLGVAYALRQSARTQTVIRGGFGIFYDLGNATSSAGFFFSPGFATYQLYSSTSFPLTPAQLVLPPPSIASPYNSPVYAFDPNLKLPYTMQWSFAAEQAMGLNQALTLTYVGSAGRRLLFSDFLLPPNNPNFSSGFGVQLTTGAASSEYNALQAQFQKKLSHGLQALVSYTWSHSIDDGSDNFFTDGLVRGSSNFDVRHNFQMALTYDVPGSYSNPGLSALLRHWGLDTRISARSALPIDIYEGSTFLQVGEKIDLRPDLVPGVPIYLYGSQYPGGKILNYNAFERAPNHTQGDLPRNFARGFGVVQADLALRRDFPVTERLHLQFRAEAFNVLNHPNFGNVDNQLRDGPYQTATLSGFGGAQATLNNALGGLNPLYQVGGPRSLQLALKLVF